jgi:phosphopantetheine adenylyltransferase
MVQNDSIFQELTAPVAEPTSANALIVVKAEESLISLSWKTSPTVTEITQTAELISDLTRQHTITRFLHDVRNIDFSNLELQKCLANTFCVQILDAGITKAVHLTTYASPELIAVDRIVDFVKYKLARENTVKFEICTTPEGAMAWLTNGDQKLIPTPVIVAQKATVLEKAQALTLRLQSAKLILKLYKESLSSTLRYALKRKGGLITE